MPFDDCGVLVILFILAAHLPGAISEDVLVLASGWSSHTNQSELVFRNAAFSEVSFIPGEQVRQCSRLSITGGHKHNVHGIFRYVSLEVDPVFEIWINSVLLQKMDLAKDSVMQVVLDPGNTSLEVCLMLVSNFSTSFTSKLELVLISEFRSKRSPARRLSEMQDHPSVVGLVGAALMSLMILTMVSALCITKLFRSPSAVKPQSPPDPGQCGSRMEAMLHPKALKQFSLKELEEAIGTRIAEGGFGYVFRGRLPNRQEVAIKVRSSTSSQGLREFTAEITLLSKITHENLVPLLGYCNEGQQEMLVYPYMTNGTLQDRLYGEAAKRKPLDWQTRLSIALGAARGLSFLHSCGPRPIIHRDVKSSNILLDDSMNARVADFGFSRFAPDDDSLVSVEVRGTTGYLDPEYYMTQVLTTKSDVFSFGVVLLEIICGREPLNLRRPRPEASLIDWARSSIDEANIQKIIDPVISASFTPEAMWRVLEVAYASVAPNADRRPLMADVVRELDDALIIENNASQYMLSMDSIGSFRRSTSIKLAPYPAPVPFDPSPAFSETLDSPHPR